MAEKDPSAVPAHKDYLEHGLKWQRESISPDQFKGKTISSHFSQHNCEELGHWKIPELLTAPWLNKCPNKRFNINASATSVTYIDKQESIKYKQQEGETFLSSMI